MCGLHLSVQRSVLACQHSQAQVLRHSTRSHRVRISRSGSLSLSLSQHSTIRSSHRGRRSLSLSHCRITHSLGIAVSRHARTPVSDLTALQQQCARGLRRTSHVRSHSSPAADYSSAGQSRHPSAPTCPLPGSFQVQARSFCLSSATQHTSAHRSPQRPLTARCGHC